MNCHINYIGRLVAIDEASVRVVNQTTGFC